MLLISGAFAFVTSIHAQEAVNDSLQETRRSNQNVMLNASSATEPRTISLGIPSSGSAIFEDGAPVTFFLGFFPGHWSWHSGLNTESMNLSTLDESALRVGIIGYFPSTTSKVTANKLEAGINYSISQYGQHQVDLNVGAPLGNGWGFNLNTYQDFDRGSNHLDLSYLQERIQFYKLAISKAFDNGKGRLALTYNYMNTLSINDVYGPFIFVGDGNVKTYQGFDLGHDQYLPSVSTISFMDVRTGEMKKKSLTDDAVTKSHMVTFNLKYNLRERLDLEFISRFKHIHTDIAHLNLGAIDTPSGDSQYTYVDGTKYEGAVQNRFFNTGNTSETNWMNTVELKGKSSDGKHDWFVATNIWFDHTDFANATGNMAHEAKKDPESLLFNKQQFYVFNTGAGYFKGDETKIAFYGRNQWKPNKRLSLAAGARVEYMRIRGKAANNINGETNNTRMAGWNILMPQVKLNDIKEDWINTSATLTSYYRFSNSFALQADAFATFRRPELTEYSEAQAPVTDIKSNYMFRAGFNYRNSWLDLQSLLTYIIQKNNFSSSLWTHTLTKAAGGYPEGYQETVYIPSFYSINAFGWVTDFILTPFRGFSFHGLINMRAPRYKNYMFEPTFSDGYKEAYDFSNKKVTGISSVEIEFEPSYTVGKWRVWASARYYSRQYINRTNTLYFNPRWETFGGIDFNWTDKVSFAVNVINFLNQKGASAGIQAASLATDPTPFKNYLTSGTYIRPFTLEFSTRIRL